MCAGYGNTCAQQEPWQAAGFCWTLRAALRQYGRPPFTPEQLALITELVQVGVTAGRVSAPVTATGLAPGAETKLPQHCFLSLTGTGRGRLRCCLFSPRQVMGWIPAVDSFGHCHRGYQSRVPRRCYSHVHGRSRRAATEAH